MDLNNAQEQIKAMRRMVFRYDVPFFLKSIQEFLMELSEQAAHDPARVNQLLHRILDDLTQKDYFHAVEALEYELFPLYREQGDKL